MEMQSPRLGRLLPVALAVLIMGSAITIAVLSRSTPSSVTTQSENIDSPEACIARMQVAEEQGDVSTYLDCFCDAERGNLEKQWTGLSQSQIASVLRDKSTGVMGRATTNVKLTDSNHAELVLEFIRQESVDRQSVTLGREGGRWKVISISATDRTTPKIPYGTPVDAQQ